MMVVRVQASRSQRENPSLTLIKNWQRSLRVGEFEGNSGEERKTGIPTSVYEIISCFYFIETFNQRMSLQNPVMALNVYFNMNTINQVKCSIIKKI